MVTLGLYIYIYILSTTYIHGTYGVGCLINKCGSSMVLIRR